MSDPSENFGLSFAMIMHEALADEKGACEHEARYRTGQAEHLAETMRRLVFSAYKKGWSNGYKQNSFDRMRPTFGGDPQMQLTQDELRQLRELLKTGSPPLT